VQRIMTPSQGQSHGFEVIKHVPRPDKMERANKGQRTAGLVHVERTYKCPGNRSIASNESVLIQAP
jgi:hypothetical protein